MTAAKFAAHVMGRRGAAHSRNSPWPHRGEHYPLWMRSSAWGLHL